MTIKNTPLFVAFIIQTIICFSLVIPAHASFMVAEVTGDKTLYVYGIDTTTEYAYTAQDPYRYQSLISPEQTITSLSASKTRGHTREHRSLTQPPPSNLCSFPLQIPAVQTTITTNWMLQNASIQMQRDANFVMTNWNGTGLFQYKSSEEKNGEQPLVHRIIATGNSNGSIFSSFFSVSS
ncbi:MAG: hypothetical protein LBV40_02715 [Methanomicrobiales archaeon]|jgi:hypothetical protein|nr:hypothetical protein [Methanomicrobiales archaeon]